MKALICKEHGLADKLELAKDWPNPELGDNDVLINVKAAGLNFPDVLIIQGKYQIQPEMPFIPGGECSGEGPATGRNSRGRDENPGRCHRKRGADRCRLSPFCLDRSQRLAERNLGGNHG